MGQLQLGFYFQSNDLYFEIEIEAPSAFKFKTGQFLPLWDLSSLLTSIVRKNQ